MRTIGTIDLTQKTQNDTAIRHNSVGTIVPVVPIVPGQEFAGTMWDTVKRAVTR